MMDIRTMMVFTKKYTNPDKPMTAISDDIMDDNLGWTLCSSDELMEWYGALDRMNN